MRSEPAARLYYLAHDHAQDRWWPRGAEPAWGRFRIRVKSGHKAGQAGAGAFGDFGDDPSARSAGDLALNLADAEVGGGSERLDLGDDALRYCRPAEMLPRVSAALMPAVTRSLMSDDSSSAIAPMMMNIYFALPHRRTLFRTSNDGDRPHGPSAPWRAVDGAAHNCLLSPAVWPNG
jgi:hypothetical protein